MIVDDLPLLELFTRLRQAGLPLGVDEYHLVLRALQIGFGIPDRAALARLCRTLWVKSADDARLFDYYFEQVMAQPITSEAPVQPSTQLSRTPSTAPTAPPDSLPSEKAATAPTTASEVALNGEDEIQVAKAVMHNISSDGEAPYNSQDDDDQLGHLIQTDEYFPVTRREMKQHWRYLRRPIREGSPAELDVEATVNRIGRQGMLLDFVLVPRRINRAELLLLIDQGGSMVPFHTLSRRLAETALRGGRLGRAGIYYFHNCPMEYLYCDSHHLEAVQIQNILDQLYRDRTGVLILSDAGAARGGYSPERVKLTVQFLDGLKRQLRYIAWLNPMRPSRWLGTTAEEIKNYVPMFDISRRGLDEAINVLRGRPSRFVRTLRHENNE